MEDDAYNVSEFNLDYESKISLRSIAISLKRIADAVCLPGPNKAQMNLAEVVSQIEMNTRKN